MKVTISIGKVDDYCQGRIDQLRRDFPEIEFPVIENQETMELKSTDILLARSLTTAELDKAPKLRALFVPYTGLNRFPVSVLKEREIVVSNSHGKAAVVAERALALALSVMGRVVEMHNSMTEGIWISRRKWREEFWNSLFNKKCGIYGMGHIAENLVRLLGPFNATVVGLERDRHKGLAHIYVPDVAVLARESDILFVSVPLSPETRGSIGREVLSGMTDKFIVNVGRGEVIDEEALYWALSEKILAGAGIDVWYNYPEINSPEPALPSRYPIHKLPNVVMSPHAATHAIEARDGYYQDTFDQLEHYLRYGQAKHPVNLAKHL